MAAIHDHGVDGDMRQEKPSTGGANVFEPMAIIGFSIRFPQEAISPGGLWDILVQGRSVMTEVPPDRFNIDGFYHPDSARHDTISSRGGHFLSETIRTFDAPFFSISSSEAECMDPQHRCLLETSYHALENAGIPIEKAAGSKTSVFAGSVGSNYSIFFDADEEVNPTYRGTGTGSPLLSNRISWFFDLRGPSMSVETACSSSMVALHLACQSLRSRESTMSLVCGSQLYLEPLSSAIGLSTMNFTSPDSRCHSFDERANGYAKGEGFGVLVVKPLVDAIAAGDTIRAVIRATAMNQDGRTPGLTQPSQEAQENLIREAYRVGGLDLDETRLFETHGPGTALGDLIEASAIKAVFDADSSSRDPIYIGAIKSNIGHLEATAGIAGIVKAVLCLEKGIIPPNAGFETLNSKIQADVGRLRFPKTPTNWPKCGIRRASVNSFGYGGSNAHAVLDDAHSYFTKRGIDGFHSTLTQQSPIGKTRDTAEINGSGDYDRNKFAATPVARVRVFVWSAADAAGIQRLAVSYKTHLFDTLASHLDSQHLKNLAFTLSEKRSVLPWKSYFLAQTVDDLKEQLYSMPKPSRSSTPPRLHFVFTGQGAQWARMGIELAVFPAFQTSLIQADRHFKSLGCVWSLTEEIEKPIGDSRLNHPELAQPICTALQIALVELLDAWNIHPDGVVGHSSGEISAAFCAGAISRESAWTIAYYRGLFAAKLMTPDSGRRGAMMAVQLSETEAQSYIDELLQDDINQSLSVGCSNSPKSTTVTGDESLIERLKTQLDEDEVLARKLRVPVAYHSDHMLAIADEYLESIMPIERPQKTTRRTEHRILASSVTGDVVTLATLSRPEYWVKNLVSKVRFSEAIKALQSATPSLSAGGQKQYYVEIGPHATLQMQIKESLSQNEKLLYDSTLRRNVNSLEAMLNLAGKLFVLGFAVAMHKVNDYDPKGSVEMLIDLPQYPFNHSQSYWIESRIFRNYLQRSHIRHELLGVPSADWNPLKPRWRNTIRISELPWLEDHQVNGTILYPASAMLVMVIEAVRSIARSEAPISGYRFRDVSISSGITIPPGTEGVEVQLYMQSPKNIQTTSIASMVCDEFWLCSYANNEWKEVCSGKIITEYVERSSGIYSALEGMEKFNGQLLGIFEEIIKKCDTTNTQDRMYRVSRQRGYEFGPTFQTLYNVTYSQHGGHVSGTVILDDWIGKLPNSPSVQDHIIHPTSMDAVLQAASALASNGGTIPTPLRVPTYIAELWVSHGLLLRDSGAALRVAAKTQHATVRHADAFVVAVSSSTHEPALFIDGYRETTVMGRKGAFEEHRSGIYALEWKPAVDILSPKERGAYCLQATNIASTWDPSRDVVCLYFLTKTLQELEKDSFESSTTHFRKYVDWIRRHLNRLQAQSPLQEMPWREMLITGEFDQYLAKFATRSRVDRALVLFCSQLTRIVREEQDPLDLLFNQGLANDIYSDEVFQSSGSHTAAFIELVAHTNPGMDILEIGAGTGSVTEPVLTALSRQFGSRRILSRCNSYTFTDISPSFFEKAKDRFSSYADRLKFQTLDIERDPVSQGFEANRYDMVLAAMVLHATANIEETLQHVNVLLKPGGYLVLVEVTDKDSTTANGVWGTLSGWWRSIEADRELGPLYSVAEWQSCFERHGFTSLDMVLPDHPDIAHHTLSVLVARSLLPPRQKPTQQPSRAVIIAKETSLQRRLATEIASYLNSEAIPSCDIRSLSSMLSHDTEYDLCVSILDVEGPTFTSMCEDEFTAWKKTLRLVDLVFWITIGGGAYAQRPENAMSSGFGRAMMREQPGLRFVTVDVENPNSVLETFQKLFTSPSNCSEPSDFESDYIKGDGLVSIPRIVEADESRFPGQTYESGPRFEKRVLGKDASEALELQFTLGQLDSFHFARDEAVLHPLGEDEVEVQVKATGINFMDVLAVLGRMNAADIGYECSGVVLQAGTAVSTLSRGDRVCCLTPGSFKTIVRSKEYATICIPQSLPFTEAFPGVYATAIYGVSHLGRLRTGESILIHAAAGAVGQAAIQIAKSIGADIFVTVSSVEKRALLMQQYGIPQRRIFYSRNLSFGRQIMDATKGRGVDVILNSLSGESLAESWRILAPLGRFIEIGKADIQTNQNLAMQPFSKNVSYHSIDLLTLAEHSPGLIKCLMGEMVSMLSAGTISAPQPVAVYTRADFETAVRYLQTGHHMGKAVVNWETEAEVTVVARPEIAYQLDPNASYVIVGGFGGIGKSLAAWFARRGVKYLVILSRSGATSDSARDLMQELASHHVHVAAPECDISDTASLKKVLDKVAVTMPPIKGCIQGSMVLRDRSFQNMSYEEWQAVFRPKIKGTWNLHDLLPSKMDFFILLSSLGGMIGWEGQSQYDAASTFQDAFARHRWHLGEQCISIDIGFVMDIGYAAEHGSISKKWSDKGGQVLYEEDIHRVVDWACNPAHRPSSPWLTQIITAAGAPSKTIEEIKDQRPFAHLKRPLFRHILGRDIRLDDGVSRGSSTEMVDYGPLLRSAESVEGAGGVIAAALAKRLSKALSVPLEDVDTSRPAYSYGVDSLVAAELRFWFANETKAVISVLDILSNESIEQLGLRAARKSDYVRKAKMSNCSEDGPETNGNGEL
ncbi:hypothetical protein F5Y03DRAFT_254380 [Xylaria venustula]|nr:hypothetical protein F5Y03DRAFT_254380 [Xylaria venustula]